MRTTTCISLLLLALAPIASAEEATIGFEDASLDAMPPPASAWADLVSGTLALDGETLVGTLELVALPEMQSGIAYVIVFSANGTDWFLTAYTAPTLAYAYGPWVDDAPADFAQTRGSYATGPGGTVTVEMPLSVVADAGVLSSPRGYAVDIKSGAAPVQVLPPFVVLDEARGEGELHLPSNATSPASGGPVVERASVDAPTRAAADPAEPETASRVPGAGGPLALVALAAAVFASKPRRA